MIRASNAFKTAAIAFAICAGTAANAAIEQKCYEGDAQMSQLRAELKAQGQAPVYVGNADNIGTDGQIVFTNVNGNGYIVAVDTPLKIRRASDGTVPASRLSDPKDIANQNKPGWFFQSAPSKMCVGVEFTNFRAYRLTGAGAERPPLEALSRVDNATAQAALKRDTVGSAGVHNLDIAKRYANGARVAFTADDVVAFPNGRKVIGARIVFSVNARDSERQARIGLLDNNGVGTTLGTMSFTTATNLVTELMPTQVAMADTSSPSSASTGGASLRP